MSIKQILKNGIKWINDVSVTVFCKYHYREQAKTYCQRNGIQSDREFENNVKKFWKKYGQNVSPVFASWYSGCNGIDDVKYIPEDLFYDKVERHFNNVELEQAYVDKGMYGLLFPDIKQPETVVININGIFYDREYSIISESKAMEMIKNTPTFVIKPTRDSGGGKNVQFVREFLSEDKIRELIGSYSKDYIIQKPLRQHSELARIHEKSINTVRVMSMLEEGKVRIISSLFRMGVGDSCVDNVCSGGINCGINEDGSLSEVAYNGSGKVFYEHPQGTRFSDIKLNHYVDILDVIFMQHKKLPHFRIISWDFTVSETGEPIMIELNLRWQGLNSHQLHHGPLFGNDTERILNEVFKK